MDLGRERQTASLRPAPAGLQRLALLALCGTAAGLFSGVFGVGGGSVIVPSLVLLLGYNQREAAGTSLVAICLIASLAAAIQAAYGNVKVGHAVSIGLPAVVGVLAGAAAARRLPHRILALLFSLLLVAAAIQLILE